MSERVHIPLCHSGTSSINGPVHLSFCPCYVSLHRVPPRVSTQLKSWRMIQKTGVFSWCVISWLREIRKLSFVIRDLKFSCNPWRTWIINWYQEKMKFSLADIRNFTTQFYVIMRFESSEWLESSMESDLRIRIWNLEPWLNLSRLCFLQTLFLV